jgi:hypothetical protein
MFKQAKNSLENLSQLDTAKYIKMAKKIKEEYENPSNKLDHTLKSMSNTKPGSFKHIFYNLQNYI